ncbi:FkbM family methyltransferase [Dechloromonas denitrificans]|uniref:FkbM family methyltransferase n=1 Tax=Dechloromonas denitrificans TaxID=281362 RepID=UPI001CF8E6B9|nr:FkbM family methyltransferase [Dechloromonas denitrificans]UCV04585.1 FkbM family methyltransferase [Dechloromonas denitrificans]UCV08914.1 FkbM family methyltransferase [Dechloromonas denitrificans]
MGAAASALRTALEAEFAAPAATSENSIGAGILAGRPIVVYGAGECSHWFFEIAMKMHGCQPRAVLDRSFANGGLWQGIPAFAPDDYRPSIEEQRDGLVVICVGNRALHGEIQACLARLGFAHVVFLHDIYEIHNPFNQPPEAALRGLDYFRENRQRILSAFDLLADDESRMVYLRFLQTHMQRKPAAMPQRPRDEQYFPRDIPLSRGHGSYVCCGAYDGDTVRLLQQTCGKVDTIACFEPEPHIYARLTEYLQHHAAALAERILTWPCAVYGHSGQMPFRRGDGLGSRISDQGSSVVQCVTLDQALPGLHPTFISMDVEGAEPEVLRGAERLIRESAPDLGICVYHSADHVWEIPLQLAALDIGYKFYLRNYTGFAIETVLYASR